MKTQNTLNTVQDFLEWMEENTYWEVMEYSGLNYFEEDGYFYGAPKEEIIRRYKDYLSEED